MSLTKEQKWMIVIAINVIILLIYAGMMWAEERSVGEGYTIVVVALLACYQFFINLVAIIALAIIKKEQIGLAYLIGIGIVGLIGFSYCGLIAR